jgi:hypothetical protein
VLTLPLVTGSARGKRLVKPIQVFSVITTVSGC